MEYSNPYENKNLKPPFVIYYDVFETFAKEVGAELEISMRLLPPRQIIISKKDEKDDFYRQLVIAGKINASDSDLATDYVDFGFTIILHKDEKIDRFFFFKDIFVVEKMPESKETVREMLQVCWDELYHIDTSSYHNWERIQIYGEAYKALQRERIKGKKPKLATDTLYKAL